MKRFLLFSGMDYYPRGGWDDFKGTFDSVKDAVDHLVIVRRQDCDWWHIVDTKTKKVVKHGQFE